MKKMMLCLAWLGMALAAPATAQISPATVRIASAERVPHAATEPAPSADLRLDRSLDRIRKVTAPYLDLIDAVVDGWTERYPLDCAVTPEGAWAYHFMNPALMDDQVELLRPELLMYEPQEDGSLELVGVKYVIPFEAWTDAGAPTLLGERFTRNAALGAWALDVWAWRTNPMGLFAVRNPDVSCAHAW